MVYGVTFMLERSMFIQPSFATDSHQLQASCSQLLQHFHLVALCEVGAHPQWRQAWNIVKSNQRWRYTEGLPTESETCPIYKWNFQNCSCCCSRCHGYTFKSICYPSKTSTMHEDTMNYAPNKIFHCHLQLPLTSHKKSREPTWKWLWQTSWQ